MREISVLNCGLVPYETASGWQDDLHRRRVAGEITDVLLLLEHPNAYTMGRRSAEEHLLLTEPEMAARGIRLHRTDRGGSITFHGPGQLVAYPIVDLRRDESFFVDVIKYVRLLEEAIIQTLQNWGIESGRREGMTGVWVGREKIAAIGVRISRGVAKHGVSLNVRPDMALFGGIVPCGLAAEGVTSMERLLADPVSVDEVEPVLSSRLTSLLGRDPVVRHPRELGLEGYASTGNPAGGGGPPLDPAEKGAESQRSGSSVVEIRENRPRLPSPRPVWLKTRVTSGPNFKDLKRLVRSLDLHTVCEEAGCPNVSECWEAREATFLILGKQCTRRCGFCDIATGKPNPLDVLEPARVAKAVEGMGLNYAVVTGVERDDVPPSAAAGIWAATVRAIKNMRPSCGVEVLTGDLKGDLDALRVVLEAGPDVFAHNVETVPRLHKAVRPGFRYERSLHVLKAAKQIRPMIPTKSNLILGLGETKKEVLAALGDLRQAGVDIMTVGQYLSPSPAHLPVERWVTPEEFFEIKQAGERLGFAWVESGPLVRSSFHAGEQHRAALSRLAERSPAAIN